MSYAIKPIPIKGYAPQTVCEYLPDLDKLKLLCIAPTFSGKTNVICNLLENKAFGFKKYYGNNIFLFSPTYKSDRLYQKMIKDGVLDEENCFTTYDWDVIREIHEDMKGFATRIKKFEKRPSALIIIDDLATSLKGQAQKALVNAFMTWRHWKISFIITSQQYKLIPLAAREQANCILLFPNRMNEKDIQAFAEEQPLSRDKVHAMFEGVRDMGAYHFICYRPDLADINERYSVCFEDKIECK